MNYLWIIYEFPTDYLWISVDYLWMIVDSLCLPMDCYLWTICGLSIDHLKINHGLSMEWLWT